MGPIGIIANVGPAELGIILVIILLLFGAAKLPKLARSLGQAQREFKKGLTENTEADNGDTRHENTANENTANETASGAASKSDN